MAFVNFVVTLASNLLKPPEVMDTSPIPIEAFRYCRLITHYQFKMVPHSMSTVFGA